MDEQRLVAYIKRLESEVTNLKAHVEEIRRSDKRQSLLLQKQQRQAFVGIGVCFLGLVILFQSLRGQLNEENLDLIYQAAGVVAAFFGVETARRGWGNTEDEQP